MWEYPNFDSLVAELSPSEKDLTISKDEIDLLVPVAEWHDLHRANKNVARFGALFMADFDRLTDEQMGLVLDAIEGTSCYVYTTFSHLSPKKDHTNCFRVLIELDQEYPPEHHLPIWDALNARFHGLMDEATRTLHTPYYLPARPAGGEFLDVRIHGRKTCVQELVGAGAQSTPAPTPRREIDTTRTQKTTRAALLSTLEGWARYRGSDEKRINRALLARDAKLMVRDKKPKSIKPGGGGRHDWMVSLAGLLAHQYPRADAAHLCSHFDTEGWAAFEDGDAAEHGIDRLTRMVDDFQLLELEQQAQAEAEAEAEQKRAIRQSTNGERDYPLTDEEARALEARLGPGWTQYAVLQFKNGFFLMDPDGSYQQRLWTRDELLLAARDHFMVFYPHVRLTFEDQNDQTHRHSYDSFRNEYASALVDVWYDQTVAESVFDPIEMTLAQACAPPKVEPIEHPHVQNWLLRAGGELLVDMTAGMSRLNEMLPALVLTGKKDAGKTLYANGVAGIWGTAPNDAKDTHTQFNVDQMLRQPITFHDEKAGAAYAKEGTSLVRQFTTQGERWVEGKYLPKVRLKGYPRLIFAANNAHILDTHEAMTGDDREAFADRLVHVHLQGPAAPTRAEWLDPRHLSEHFLWLGRNWEIQSPGNRFLVKGPRTSLHEGLAGGTGTAAEVVQWLLSYIANPERVDSTADAPIEINAEKQYLRVTASAIMQHWEQYLKSQMPRRTNEVQKALRSISAPGFQKILVNLSGGRERRLNAYEVDLALLRSNLDRHHLTEEEFDAVLGLDGGEAAA